MNKTEEQFKKDFESAKKPELSFDTNQLKPEPVHIQRKSFPWKIVIPVGCSVATLALVITGCVAFVNAFLMEPSGVKTKRMRLSMNEISIARSNTFKPLNSVSYPDGEMPQKSPITDAENNAYNNFANLTYQSLVKTSNKPNLTYSPLGLYSVMNEIYGSISRDDLEDKFDALLGLSESERVYFYKKVMLANSFAGEENTIQLKNAAFFKAEYNPNAEYVNKLTELYTQAYTCDFNNSKDVNKMLEWANDAVKANNFINKDFLEIDSATLLIWFSTLYFKNAWQNKYLSSGNKEDTFYLADGQTKKVTYMEHMYFTDCYYDYGDYISFRDYYSNGIGSVTYIVPKYYEDDIYELTKNVNIFKENEECKIVPNSCDEEDPDAGDWCEPSEGIRVWLSTPKFKNTVDFKFNNTMADLGLGDMFDPRVDSFHNAFNDSRLDNYTHYLGIFKQKNEVEFNEDGSIIKSLTVASMEAGAAAMPRYDTIEVELNQPFIYIIRDINDTPIFVGHVDNPSY